MTSRKSSSLKSKPTLRNLDFEGLFRRMDEQRAKAAEMIIRARVMRIRAIEMKNKIPAPIYPNSFRP
jgi:hypothetical protein